MYHDLCIPYNASANDLQRTLLFLSELSYSIAAISFPLPAGPSKNQTTPIPALPSTSSTGLKRILTRVTLPLLSTSDLPNTRLQTLHQTYDLVVLRPTSEKTLLLATSTPDIDLISLDLSARWPFHFRPKMFSAASKRGVHFEICYGATTQASSGSGRAVGTGIPRHDRGGGSSSSYANANTSANTNTNAHGDLIPAPDASTARRNFISNATGLIRALRGGRNVVFSSEARSALGLRAPMDVVNLGVLLGLSAERGLEAVRDAPALVVRAARARRLGWRGVLLGVDVVAGQREMETGLDGTVRVGGAENAKDVANAGRGVKRKANESSGNAQMQIDKPLSKRQMKKLAQRERTAQGQDVDTMDTAKKPALHEKT